MRRSQDVNDLFAPSVVAQPAPARTSRSNNSRPIHISGHVGNDATGKVTAKTFAEEVEICFANVARALERSGASLKDVVRITCYLTDLADYPIYSKARAAKFQGNPPASATVQVAGLLVNAKIEIDAIAVVKARR